MTGEGERVTEVDGETSSVMVEGMAAAAVEEVVFLFFFLEGDSSGLSEGSRAGLLTLDRLSPLEWARFLLLFLSFLVLVPLAMGGLMEPEGLSEASRVVS